METVAALLEALGWSQRDAAAALGATRRDIRDALAGREPQVSAVRDGCQAALTAREALARGREAKRQR